MRDVTRVEDDVRRALRATADALVVDDRDFDASATRMVERPTRDRARRSRHRFVVATVVLIVLVAAAAIVRQTAGTNKGRTAEAPPTSVPAGATTSTTAPIPTSSQPAPAALIAQVASVPISALDVVGAGNVAPPAITLPGPVLTEDGKPRIIWIGAEYCPFCAAERWPLIVALARFGTFSALRVTASAAVTPSGVPEVYPDTQTFSFHGSTYTSDNLAFDAVEQTNRAYRPLDVATPDEETLFRRFDAPPYVTGAGSIPFVDLANMQLVSGASFSPAVLQGASADDIARALSDPTSDIAKAVDGTADLFTAEFCTLTNNQPANVCSDPMITHIQNSPQAKSTSTAPSG